MAAKYILGGVGGLTSYILANYYLDSSTPLHVDVVQPCIEVGGFNILPVISAVFKALPESFKNDLIAKGNSPKQDRIPDWYDHFGTDPYKIDEVVPGKVWKVEYTMENHMAFSPEAKFVQKFLGLDFDSERTAWRVMQGAEAYGRDASAQAQKDLARYLEVQQMIAEQGVTKETLKAVGPIVSVMSVVKLNNGDVMLYSPCKVRDETGFGSWLESLGPVKWIVLGSSAHTLQIPAIMKRYPDAVLIGPNDAMMKLQHVKGFPKQKLDFDYTNTDDLTRLNNLLNEEGVNLHFINGDCATAALIAIAHKTALEVDIIYSSSDGGFFNMTEEDFYKDENYFTRLFKWGLASSPTSPNNALPPYRFWFMDASSPLSVFGTTPLKKDGSSCTDMANSLRTVLAEDIDHAIGAHCNYMDGEKFKRSVDVNWSWLDGKSLLP